MANEKRFVVRNPKITHKPPERFVVRNPKITHHPPARLTVRVQVIDAPSGPEQPPTDPPEVVP